MVLSSKDCGREESGLYALIPVKCPEQAKLRLSTTLGPVREGFALAMLGDVLNALQQSQTVSRIALVTGDREVVQIARSVDAMVIPEPQGGGLNRAVETGARWLRDAGATSVLILPSDLPLITGTEIDRLVRTTSGERIRHSRPVVGICPSHDEGGTNFLLHDLAIALGYAYGPGSYRRHLEEIAKAGGRPLVWSSDSVSLDIDWQSELDDFLSRCASDPGLQETRSWNYLKMKGPVDSGQSRRSLSC